jgi:hypothetical protein
MCLLGVQCFVSFRVILTLFLLFYSSDPQEIRLRHSAMLGAKPVPRKTGTYVDNCVWVHGDVVHT